MSRRTFPVLFLALWACSSGSATEPEPEPEPEIAAIVPTSGRTQAGWPGTLLGERLVATVLDADGLPLEGVDVTWSVFSGGGSLDVVRAVSDAGGKVAADWTLGRKSVDQVVGAQAGNADAARFSGRITISGFWEPVAPLPMGVRASAVTTDGNRVFVFGGAEADGSIVPLTQIFDPATDSWTEGAPMPIGVAFGSAVHVSGQIHLLGGVSATEAATEDHWIYDIGSNSWTAGPSLPAPAAAAASALVSGVVVVAGGIDAPQTYSANVHLYDPQTSTWAAGRDAPQPIINWQGAAVGGRLLVTGGSAARRITLRRLYEYDPTSDEWASRGDMSRSIEGYAGTAAGGLYCILGGRVTPTVGSFNTPFDDVECFEDSLDLWLAGPRLPISLQEAGAIDLGDALYVIGGWRADEMVSDAVYRLPRSAVR